MNKKLQTIVTNKDSCSKQICSQYRVSVEIYDLVLKDTIDSHSWNPGYNGWDVGTPKPDSILLKISIETAPYDFYNNKPFDFFLNVNLQLKGSNTWDCMNPENPVLSEIKNIVKNEEISDSDFFNGEQRFENLKSVELVYVLSFNEFYKQTRDSYNSRDVMFILNALIITVELVEKGNVENTCLIEHYHPVCIESTKTIFDFED
jgi:hypothetical protein